MKTKNITRECIFFILLLCTLYNKIALAKQKTGFSPNPSIGLGAAYNFDTKAKGVLGRVDTKLLRRTKLIIEYIYFPKYVSSIPEYESVGISEYYLQGFVAFNLVEYRGFEAFGGIGGSASKWINNVQFDRAASRKMNYSGDVILGLQQQIKRLMLFSEYRYNLFWGEHHVQAGIGFSIAKKKQNKSTGKSDNDVAACPKFNF